MEAQSVTTDGSPDVVSEGDCVGKANTNAGFCTNPHHWFTTKQEYFVSDWILNQTDIDIADDKLWNQISEIAKQELVSNTICNTTKYI